MGRAPCCDKIGLKKGPWTTEEDEKLSSYVKEHGHGSWRDLPKKAGLLRCGKSCRLRWTNYLRPDIKRGEFSATEEQTIIQLHALLGNRWSAIATHLPKRTDNEIKNYWNTHLKKRLLSMGLDPATHKPKTESTSCDSRLSESSNNSHSSSSLSHRTQWESARLEAEARLAKESTLRAKGLWPSASVNSMPLASSKLKHHDIMSFMQDFGHSSASLQHEYGSAASVCKQDSAPSKGFTTGELLSSLQNWEYSLQGQAGLMWPDSWRFSNKGASAEGAQQECSSCSSPQEQLNHGSPTSTLCSFDQSTKERQGHNHSSLAVQTKKLSWSDLLQSKFHDQPPRHSYSNDKAGSLPYVELEGFQAVSSKCTEDQRSLSSLSCDMQDSIIQLDSFDIVPQEGKKSMTKGSSLNSSGLLDDLELVSEIISSTRSSSIMSGGKFSSEENLDHYWDNLLADSPRQYEAHESIFV
eukprot:c18545_g1_i1 orf=241-1641(-)